MSGEILGAGVVVGGLTFMWFLGRWTQQIIDRRGLACPNPDDDDGDPDDDDGDPDGNTHVLAWVEDLRDGGHGPDTLYEMERVATIADHYAEDPRRAAAVQVADTRRWAALIEDYILSWQGDVMPAGDAMVERELADMAAQLATMTGAA